MAFVYFLFSFLFLHCPYLFVSSSFIYFEEEKTISEYND